MLVASKHASPLPVRVAVVGVVPIAIVTSSLTAGHSPAGSSVVNVRVTVLAARSPALGV
ncbi:hypothetical protein ES708_08918 [subsurface metagenome]